MNLETITWVEKMSNKPLKISEQAAVQMPMKTVASLIALVAIGTWAFFGVQETLNQHSTKIELMQKDLEQNSEFRIKYPRGELGQSSGEAELFMLVEHMAGLIESMIQAGTPCPIDGKIGKEAEALWSKYDHERPDYDTYVKRMKKREKADAELQAQITAEVEAMDKYNEEQLIKKEKAKKISEWESPK